MRYILIVLLFAWNVANGQTSFPELDNAIEQSSHFDKIKEKEILVLKSASKNTSGVELLDSYHKLYDEYKVFNYDSAYHYAQLQLNLARALKNPPLIQRSQIQMAFILLSAGLFKEAFDTLNIIQPSALPTQSKMDYYTLLARCYYDLSDYTMDKYHSPLYNTSGNKYLDSAIFYQTSDFDLDYYNGLRNIRGGKIDTAIRYFRKLIVAPHLSLHQLALATSTMSDIYIQRGQTDSAITLLARAATADIQSSTKETSAIFNLANILFKKGDIKNASTYIEKAVEDAVSYGARQRKVQMSAILPLIEGEKINRVENENRTVMTYAVIVTLLLLLLVFLTYVIAKQIKKLKLAQQALTSAHDEQQIMNTKLVEANKIKEEYIGFFFNANTAFYDKIERFKKKAEVKISDRKLDEVLFLINSLNIKQERDELLKNFDSIFLKIFPHFITSYNQLFKDEEFQLKEQDVLNTELRIFALIRLGIHDNDKIANILGYSVNTINTYKTKVKNRSLVHNDKFEEKIMDIKSV